MKKLLRAFLVNLAALWATSQILPGLVITSGIQGLAIGAAAFMVINLVLVPLLKVVLLPLNLLTMGVFTWVANVVALYIMVTLLPYFKIMPFQFDGANLGLVIIPSFYLSTIYVVVVASLLIGTIIHFVHWLFER